MVLKWNNGFSKVFDREKNVRPINLQKPWYIY